MNVLFATSEAEPFIKTGGLADVSYALPKYLKRMEVDVRVVMPKYKNIKVPAEDLNFVKWFMVPVGWRNQYCGIFEYNVDGVTYYLIDNEYYFLRDGCYGYDDEAERFAFFDRAVLMLLKEIHWKADIIHCNDWQTAMVPVLYKIQYQYDPFYSDIKTVFTIHNLAYQGNFDPNILSDLFGLGQELYYNGTLEFYGAVSFMKGGISFADEITTVSKTYAEEIQTPQYGERMDGLLRSRRDHLHGIINGIDYEIYDPAVDKYIFKNYDVETVKTRTENKLKLQKQLGLSIDEHMPMIGMISRLTWQKGVGLIEAAAHDMLKMGIQLVVLGTGEHNAEWFFRNLERMYPGQVSANILFDDVLAHKIYASSDIFLMPSLFEPCGLSQLIAMRYGSLPLVHETGGLKDTVKPYNEFTGEGTGFSFVSYDPLTLTKILDMALKYYRYDEEIWYNIVVQAMNCDNSWQNSAREYMELYKSIT
ncbi:glycogen synthase GlgA [Mahella australiensis]|jgi:starch synthase|uniref:Glycogen synthase n=1 Tax=Mahella australiensis (strain DSM 15567 / CIP 107919 / 50-1 BON) TaxID=697281 RepID=F4A224_MAHA5|nr:glycogen synthase GlgA [Mahella australiensis]AEE97163.1 glycogen synthase (ADP-glucose) [Mahella australiensis 50-1 BON]